MCLVLLSFLIFLLFLFGILFFNPLSKLLIKKKKNFYIQKCLKYSTPHTKKNIFTELFSDGKPAAVTKTGLTCGSSFYCDADSTELEPAKKNNNSKVKLFCKLYPKKKIEI